MFVSPTSFRSGVHGEKNIFCTALALRHAVSEIDHKGSLQASPPTLALSYQPPSFKDHASDKEVGTRRFVARKGMHPRVSAQPHLLQKSHLTRSWAQAGMIDLVGVIRKLARVRFSVITCWVMLTDELVVPFSRMYRKMRFARICMKILECLSHFKHADWQGDPVSIPPANNNY